MQRKLRMHRLTTALHLASLLTCSHLKHQIEEFFEDSYLLFKNEKH